MEFQDWLQDEVRKLTSPETYGGIKPKKKGKKPNSNIDGFIKEIDLLKKDLDALDKKKKQDQPEFEAPNITDDELLSLGKIALSNLKISPKYYSLRNDETDQAQRKVSREEAAKIARKLEVDFKTSDFTQETFRKALQSEISRSHMKSAFGKQNKQKVAEQPPVASPERMNTPKNNPMFQSVLNQLGMFKKGREVPK